MVRREILRRLRELAMKHAAPSGLVPKRAADLLSAAGARTSFQALQAGSSPLARPRHDFGMAYRSRKQHRKIASGTSLGEILRKDWGNGRVGVDFPTKMPYLSKPFGVNGLTH